MKMEMRRGGKEVEFQGGTYSLKTLNIRMFLLDIYKNIFQEKQIQIFQAKFTQIKRS